MDNSIKETIVQKYTKTPKGWNCLANALCQPIRNSFDYHCVAQKFMFPEPSVRAEQFTKTWTQLIQPDVDSLGKASMRFSELMLIEIESPILEKFCQNPQQITAEDFEKQWEGRTTKLLQSPRYYDIKTDSHNLQKIVMFSDARNYCSRVVPEDVVVPCHQDPENHGSLKLDTMKIRIQDLMSGQSGDGLAALISLTVSWRVENPRAQAYRIVR